jgi:hypothetical protein
LYKLWTSQLSLLASEVLLFVGKFVNVREGKSLIGNPEGLDIMTTGCILNAILEVLIAGKSYKKLGNSGQTQLDTDILHLLL